MATRPHRGDRTVKLGMQCAIGVLSEIPFRLINRTIVTAAIIPSIDLILNRAAGDGPSLVGPIWLNARSYIAPLPDIIVTDVEADPARPSVDCMVPWFLPTAALNDGVGPPPTIIEVRIVGIFLNIAVAIIAVDRTPMTCTLFGSLRYVRLWSHVSIAADLGWVAEWSYVL